MNEENQGPPVEPPGASMPPPAAPAPPAPDVGGRPAPASDTSKILAALGYVFWIVALIAILIDPYKEEKFVRFHAFQALGIAVAFIVVTIGSTILSFIPFVGWILSLLLWLGMLALAVYVIILAVKAYGGEYTEVPVVYGMVEQYI